MGHSFLVGSAIAIALVACSPSGPADSPPTAPASEIPEPEKETAPSPSATQPEASPETGAADDRAAYAAPTPDSVVFDEP